MKTFIYLFCFAALSFVPSNVLSQNIKIKIDEDKTLTVEEVFGLIKEQTDYKFIYQDRIFKDYPKVELKKGYISANDLLKKSLSKGNLIVTLEADNTIWVKEESLDVVKQQGIQVSGVITDSNGQPLAGANIIEKGTINGTQTDFDGRFSLELKNENTRLVISYLGFVTQEIGITESRTLNLTLKEDTSKLDEVVLIGYGTTKVKDLTGSVVKIDSKDFQKGFVTNAEQLIANKVAGVQITPISGRPGAGSSFLLRGGASLSASNNPLFVIDGVPVGASDGPGILSALNPEDILSFSVLKDASAAAIYGSRGSNGVIIITTKKGGEGEFKVSFSSGTSISTNIFKQDVLTGNQYRAVAEEASIISGIPIEDFNLGNENTDWQDEIYQDALTTDNTISVSGGIRGLPYRLSLGYLDQDGTLKTGNFKRSTLNLNLSPSFFDQHLKVNVNIKGMSQKERIANEDVIYRAVTFDPTQPVYDSDSYYGGYWQYEQFASNPWILGSHHNPVSQLYQIDSRATSLRSIGNMQLEYKLPFFEDLSFKLNTGYDIARKKSRRFIPATNFLYNVANGEISGGDPSQEVNNLFGEFTINYINELKAILSKIEVLAGYSYNSFKTKNYNYPVYDEDGVENPGSVPNFNFDNIESTLISYFGRLIYTLDNKYVLTGSIRTDGSSRFSRANRWGVFPSVSAAWKINEENVLKDSRTISTLKLRAGYGITGQQDGIGEYEYIPVYQFGAASYTYPIGNSLIQGFYPQAVDRNRKWEQSETTNIGLDWGLYRDRLTGSFEVYKRDTKDLLNDVALPSGTNFANSIVKNIGSLENTGLEIKLNGSIVRNEDLNWNLSANYSYNENKITRLGEGDDSEVGLLSSSRIVNTVGYPRNTFFLYHQVYDVNGNPIENQMVDLNKDGLINEEDRYRTKSSAPEHIIGFSSSINYKKLTLSMAFHSNLGQYIYFQPKDNLRELYFEIIPYNFSTTYFQTGFIKDNSINQDFSDFYLQNASFLKMDNINLSYDFGNIINSKKRNSNLVVSASVQNVFVITNYTGGDPEAPWNWGAGLGGLYGAPRTYSISLNLNL
ncbi:SusC/RagA family TonB-linked outer membrane protein [Aestuariivivens sediminis]|uniref:SusC/RagA family TonB-linked outer membrane protein n=1 Tax=Aestuariivivens sediminis TaxID=2913557 RepID=UPI001F55C1F1|nr:TonB-dependent receptor [Aestuariivivens sediminis]